jgi:DNA repair exonuclease SbcCD ATPase subunit
MLQVAGASANESLARTLSDVVRCVQAHSDVRAKSDEIKLFRAQAKEWAVVHSTAEQRGHELAAWRELVARLYADVRDAREREESARRALEAAAAERAVAEAAHAAADERAAAGAKRVRELLEEGERKRLRVESLEARGKVSAHIHVWLCSRARRLVAMQGPLQDLANLYSWRAHGSLANACHLAGACCPSRALSARHTLWCFIGVVRIR